MPRRDPKDTRPRQSTAPALWRYAKSVYDDMAKGAKEMVVDGRKARVYTGAATGLFSKHRISTPYYGPVMAFLRDSGCVVLARRGNKYAPSLWVIGPKPLKEKYDEWAKKSGARNYQSRRRSNEYLQLISQVKSFKKRLGAIDIPKAFASQQKQIDELTREVAALRKGKGL